ncbi:hypothetical protein K435DRAFT_932378 [Dendrothele bispora CBS 962.96]|uniref:Tc1-like transposase DDE domain-containing protein n=1 Tax=Dendrothele bispora (strain CBS 962.96) TaxID=1314807 RepID=A0A4S8ME16_DENBC|nr:hypothetical protein K435DRAFT_932378 [Dendrothele bispora CBS 962.96]
MCRGNYCARVLRRMARLYIADRSLLPENPYGNWNETLLMNEDLCQELELYLQELGTNITAARVQEWLCREEVMFRHGITKKISLSTAQRYLKRMGFRWTLAPKGQYVDGHERADVVWERQNVFIPRIESVRGRMQLYDKDGNEVERNIGVGPEGKRVILWYHDESIFYAHDRRRRAWYHKDGPIKPYKKGEGYSLMVADFVSAEFGWLRGPVSGRSARRVFRPGKNRDGYFTNEDVVKQAEDAINILPEFGPDIEHIFIYDNATTHKKRAEDALSARHMPKSKPVPYKSGPRAGEMRPNFLVEKTFRDDSGQVIKKGMVPMTGAFHHGSPQSLYFTEGPDKGLFKGMETILKERGYDVSGKRAQCGNNFNCVPNVTDCCMRRILFNEPDFAGVKSLLETACESRGVQVLFLPKFHCELNPIEQCWGYAKRLYRLCPESSKEEDLERNTITSLDSIPIICIRRCVDHLFFNRALRYTDAYAKGLNGREAAYASRRYRGHRTIPTDYLKDFEQSGVLEKFKNLRRL